MHNACGRARPQQVAQHQQQLSLQLPASVIKATAVVSVTLLLIAGTNSASVHIHSRRITGSTQELVHLLRVSEEAATAAAGSVSDSTCSHAHDGHSV
jgi:hypothetical protein